APNARYGPKGSLADQTGFPATSVTKPITEPRSDPANKLNNTARQPRNAPIAARNFRSPRPIASRGMTSSRVTPEICVTSSSISSHARICLHQSWNNNAASNARDCSADCHTVRNNEMLKIDKRSDDQERNENPVRNPQLPGEPLPHRKEKKCGKEFHREIAERNLCTASCASTAKREPTE